MPPDPSEPAYLCPTSFDHSTNHILYNNMSGLKNSPFGKRLRASHKEPGADEDGSQVNPIFGVGGSSSTPGLDSRPTTGGGGSSSLGPDSPTRTTFRSPFAVPRVKDYGDRFVPSKDSGDLRTSYHLMDDGGQSTPHKNRIIPSESDALKGESFFLVFFAHCATDSYAVPKNKQMLFSPRYCTPKLPLQYLQRGPSHRARASYHPHPRGGDFSPTTLRPTPPPLPGVSMTRQMKHTL